MMEIISAAVFDKFFKSSWPQIAIFGRFKEQWKFVDSIKYSAIDVPVIGVKSDLTVGESEWLNQKRTDSEKPNSRHYIWWSGAGSVVRTKLIFDQQDIENARKILNVPINNIT